MVPKIATDKLRTCESRCAGFVHNCSDFHRIELIFTRRLEKILTSIGSRLRYRLLTYNCRNLRKRTVDSAPCADLRRICMGLGNLSLIFLPTQQNGGRKPWHGLLAAWSGREPRNTVRSVYLPSLKTCTQDKMLLLICALGFCCSELSPLRRKAKGSCGWHTLIERKSMSLTAQLQKIVVKSDDYDCDMPMLLSTCKH